MAQRTTTATSTEGIDFTRAAFCVDSRSGSRAHACNPGEMYT